MNWCLVSYKFYKKYLENLKYNVKKDVYFSHNFGCYSIQLDHVYERTGVTRVINTKLFLWTDFIMIW